jgi:predicted anti-sigma-YlaC factor YlaD
MSARVESVRISAVPSPPLVPQAVKASRATFVARKKILDWARWVMLRLLRILFIKFVSNYGVTLKKRHLKYK